MILFQSTETLSVLRIVWPDFKPLFKPLAVVLQLTVPRWYSPCHPYFYNRLVHFSNIFTFVDLICVRKFVRACVCVSCRMCVWLFVCCMITVYCRCFGICCVLWEAFPAGLYYSLIGGIYVIGLVCTIYNVFLFYPCVYIQIIKPPSDTFVRKKYKLGVKHLWSWNIVTDF